MKTKLFISLLFILSVFFGFADNDKYRIMIVDDPSTTITIGWDQTSGNAPTVYYDTTDHGTNYLLYTNSKTVDRTISHKGMDNTFVRLTGLLPNTNYYFVIHDSNSTSSRFWFRTAPNDLSRLSFIAGGDSRNNRTPRQDANSLVSKLKPHAVFFAGDMTDSNSSGEWKDWFDDWQLTIASDGRMFPILPARGNHETDATTIYNLFDTPNSDSYYAVTFGNDLIRAYTLNSEISVLGNQKTWLENDLNTASSNLKWKMAQYHKPMRPHTAFKAENNYLYTAWAQLFYDKGVRLVVDCDSHVAKTTWPVKPNSGVDNDEGFVVEQTNGTVYTGEGCWGAPLRDADDTKSWTRNSGSFNQFKLIFVEETKIELRTIDVNNASLVGSVSNSDPFTLPANLNVFTPSTGAVVTISNVPDTFCPIRGVVCDDNDLTTASDEEDGNCNCIGFEEATLTDKTFAIESSGDDAEEFVLTGSVSVSSTDLEMVSDGGSDQIVGLRFNNINIPKGATIHRAYIQFRTDNEVSTDATNLTFHGELSDNSNSFSTSNYDISSRTPTLNSIDWNDIKPWEQTYELGLNQRTPYLNSIITEVITQPGWQVGNPITFIISGTGKRVAVSRNGNVNYAPQLTVLYNSNCPITNITPSTQSVCNDGNDTYSQDLIVEYNVAPPSGSLVVNGQTFPIGTSPQTVTLTGLAADGLDVDITAYFTAEACNYEAERAFEAASKCSLGGIPDNIPDDNSNLGLLAEATLYGTAIGGRGTPEVILYDPLIDDYHIVTDYNEYGVNFSENIGTPSVDDGFKWQVNWPNVKYMNYITFGGSYSNQDQSNSLWIISHRKDGVWTTLASGTGGWIDDGIFEWGGPNFDPIEADALRVQVYSDGTNSLVSIHLRARGGISNYNNDATTTPKATLIQYLSPGNSCGVIMPANSILYCNGSWINTDNPDNNTGTKNTIIADGTYTIAVDDNVEINDLEILSGATVIVKEGATFTVNGDLVNNGNLILESISTKYSSLIVEGTSTGNIIYKRYVNNSSGTGAATNSNDLISAPVTGQTFGNFRSVNPNIRSGNINGSLAFLYGPFDPASDSFINYSPLDDSSTLDAGIGYRSGSTNGSTYTFEGIVQTGNVSIPIVAGGASDWNLIGNPYPSYIDFITFFNLIKTQLDVGSSQAIYGYDGNASNGWTILNNLSTGELIAPGQGFFVKSKSGGGAITYTPQMRVGGSSDDFIVGRSTNTNFGHLKLQASATDNSYNTDIYFNSNATPGLDPGYDAALYSSSPPSFSIYSHLVEDNVDIPFGIQAINNTALSDVTIALGVNAYQGQETTIRIFESDLPSTVNVYLDDTFKHTLTLLNTGDYKFTPTTNISGVGRFYLRIEANALSIEEPALDRLKISSNLTKRTIDITGQLDSASIIKLYDIHGRIILTEGLNIRLTQQSVDVSILNSGIYIVELKSDTGEKRIQKLIIK